ncbi:MAG TPA: exopolysaccharide biosynthesis polyprenyl glycosylphosphotransferase [Actinomycetota bacterium]|nr:exopolysaccharide biosynthesis polyprenyl glycosylphosphotransferase [Actinomycetota bacterium]
MPPPVQQQALEVGVTGEIALTAERRWRLSIPLRDLVALTDMWLLLGIVWSSRVTTGYVDPSVALVAVASFAFLASPSADRRLDPRPLDDVGSVVRSVTFAFAVAAGVSALWDVGEPRTALFAAAAAAPALVGGRFLSYSLARRARQAGVRNRVLVVGAGDIAKRVVSTLSEHAELGLHVVGVVDDDPKYAPNELGAAILGGTRDIVSLVEEREIDHVVVAFSSGDQRNIIGVVRDALATGAGVWVVPRLFELGSAGNSGDHLWGLPLSRLRPPARSRRSWVVKRTLDVVIAGAALVGLAPAFAALALATLIDSGRPIFLKQRRVGLDGKPFDLLKFRTMTVCEESVLDREWVPDDQRITRVGRFLRDSSLDELPQLVNVVRGEMSIVGPRPERPYFVSLFSGLYPGYDSRHRLPAGITGWAQIHGLKGSETSIEERAAFDNYYIENWSLGEDFKIMLRTWGSLKQSQRGGTDG